MESVGKHAREAHGMTEIDEDLQREFLSGAPFRPYVTLTESLS